jgi:DNA-binding transcriptional LysR family regulator
MNDRFVSMQLFARVARTGSLTGVARETGLSQPSISRIISSLEKRVGVALLTRTTRAVTLTEAGAEYLERAEAILAALEEADHNARGDGELRGLLRIATSSSFAIRNIIPRLVRFTDAHPALRIEFIMADQRQDLVSESIDLAIRIGSLADSTSAVARKIGATERVLVAAPSYLEKVGTPRGPADLAAHSLIIGPAGRGYESWSFTQANTRPVSVRLEGRLIVNGNDSAVAAAVAGLGIATSGHIGCIDELRRGSLVRVLPDWYMGTADIHVILPDGRAAKPSARAFAAFMQAAFPHLLPDTQNE